MDTEVLAQVPKRIKAKNTAAWKLCKVNKCEAWLENAGFLAKEDIIAGKRLNRVAYFPFFALRPL